MIENTKKTHHSSHKQSNFDILSKALAQKGLFLPRFCRLLAITRILSLFKTKTINLEQKWTRKSAGRIWPMIHFALKKCSQVRSLSELKSCPSLGEKPTCVARCSRSVKNTIKHPARVYHIDIMQVIPISGHFGTLEAKKRAHFPPKTYFFLNFHRSVTFSETFSLKHKLGL